MYKRASFFSCICLVSGLVIASACGDDEPSAAGTVKPTPNDGDGDSEPVGDGDGDSEPVGDGDGDEPVGDGDGDEPVGDGDGDEPVGDGDGDGEPGDGDGDNAAFLRGKKLTDDNACTSCHQANYAGLAYFSNVTPDLDNGIGSWTDAQIAAALKDGVDPKGAKLCNQMPKFAFSESELADVIAFLRGLPAVSKKITSTCNF